MTADPAADWTPARRPRKARPSKRRDALLARVDRAISGLEREAELVEIYLDPRHRRFVDERQFALPGVP